MALTSEQISLVKSTAPVLQQYGTDITKFFYASMLGDNPDLKNMFNLSNQRNGAQQAALANAVLAYAAHIDDLAALGPAVEHIAQKHASLGVTPAQYDVVGKHLFKAFGAVLGDGLTPEVAAAWAVAYDQLKDIFIGREKQLYDEAGDWTGWQQFKIDRKQRESESVTSFYLRRSQGAPSLPPYRPGQYVSLRVRIPELGNIWQARQYSLSEAPSQDHYRISVKREDGGAVSNELHERYAAGDEVELSFPRGDFYLTDHGNGNGNGNVNGDGRAENKTETETKTETNGDSSREPPVVLISAGVGATPLMSIFETVMQQQPARQVHWIQAGRNSSQLPFARKVRELAAASGQDGPAKVSIFCKSVAEGDELGQDYDFEGPLDLGKVREALEPIVCEAEFYICGPRDWMLATRSSLEAMGVPSVRIKLEIFGTGGLA